MLEAGAAPTSELGEARGPRAWEDVLMCRGGTTARVVGSWLLLAMMLVFAGAGEAAKRKPARDYVLTDIDLQLELMNYADRYAAVVTQAGEDVLATGPAAPIRRLIVGEVVYSSAAAFTIAADPEPQVALLDLIVLTTLGHAIFREHWRPRHGAVVDPMVTALGKLEGDIWALGEPILSDSQGNELRERISRFRRDNPELTTFSNLRFADFPSSRAESSLKKQSSGGIFSSVRRVTEQVEETQILVERAMYLATRLPLLAGGFADSWILLLSDNPTVSDLRGQIATFADVADRLAILAEQLPDQLTAERTATIRQVMEEASVLREESLDHMFGLIANERTALLQQLADEEARLGGLLTELRYTLDNATTLTTAVGELTEQFDTGEPAAQAADPVEMADVHQAIAETTAAVQELNRLVVAATDLLNSPGADRLTGSMSSALGAATTTTQGLVDYITLRIALLIVLLLVGYVFARLTYHWLARRLLGRHTP
jgi:hypothetical protein